MSKLDTSAAAPHVGVYALIGQDERLHVIKHPDTTPCPVALSTPENPIEQALRRMLRDQLDATIAHSDFWP
jgi:hypothetical protein